MADLVYRILPYPSGQSLLTFLEPLISFQFEFIRFPTGATKLVISVLFNSPLKLFLVWKNAVAAWGIVLEIKIKYVNI